MQKRFTVSSHRLLSIYLAVTLFSSLGVAVAEDGIQGQPAPESADELLSSFDEGLEGKQHEYTALKDVLENSKLKLKVRNYYLNRSRPENTDPRAWAQGGSVEYSVDKVAGYFGLTAEYFGSFKLHGPEENDGTLLLESGQNNITTLGVLNPRINLAGHIISAYKQKFDLPFLNAQDNRMVPITYEGYVLGRPKAENETFQYVLGYVSEMKKRNEEQFQSMSEGAGVVGKERGLVMAGGRYFFTPNLSLAAVNYFVDDVFNIAYTEAVYKSKFSETLANALSLQYAEQRSVGQDLLLGEEFTTFFWGVQNALSYANVTGKAVFTFNDTGATIRSPYGSYAGYNSGIFEDFNRAGEKAWQLGLAYNFARFGYKGVGISTGYIHGFDAIDEVSKDSLADKEETDVTLDYKILDGTLKGFWLRLRGAWIQEDGKGTTQDYRIIVNYELPVLG